MPLNYLPTVFLWLNLAMQPVVVPQNRVEIVKPIVDTIEIVEVVASPSAKPVISKSVMGKVSHYSVDGCLGCSSTLTMSNGERLDDSVATIACNRLPLNSKVRVTNLDNGLSVIARVTDRGGFEKYGRIADLTPAVYEVIGTKTDVSNVLIEVLE